MQNYDNKEMLLKLLTRVDLLPVTYHHIYASQGRIHYKENDNIIILNFDNAMKRVICELIDPDNQLIGSRALYFRYPIYHECINYLQDQIVKHAA